MNLIKDYFENKRVFISSMLITLLGGLLRLFRVTKKSLWIDELGQIFVSSKDIPGIIEAISGHLSPPLDYLLLHLTLSIGDSEFLVRLNSVIFGTLTIYIFYQLTQLAFDTEVAFFSSLLLAFSRFHIHFSQEARMYSLFCLLTTLSFFYLWLYVSNEKVKYLILLFVTDLALLYTHYFSIYVIITHGLYLFLQILLEKKPGNLKEGIRYLFRPFLGFLIVGILYIPWLNVLKKQIDRRFNNVSNSLNFLNMSGYDRVFIRASWSNWPSFNNQPNLIIQFIIDKFQAIFNLPWPKYFFTPAEIIFPILGFIGLFYFLLFRSNKKPTIFISFWLFIPLVFNYLIYIHWATRYFIFILPAYLVLVALGIVGLKEWLTKKWSQRAGYLWVDVISTILIMVILSSLISYYYYNSNDDWRNVGKYLEKYAEPKDKILVLGGNSANIEYYYQGPAEVIDADHHFRDPDIENMEEFLDFINIKECKWIFISQHSNKLFVNVFVESSKNVEKIEPIRKLLSERFDLVEKVYTLSGYKLKKDDLPGLYRSTDCKPQ